LPLYKHHQHHADAISLRAAHLIFFHSLYAKALGGIYNNTRYARAGCVKREDSIIIIIVVLPRRDARGAAAADAEGV